MPEGHEGREIYGVIEDEQPDKGRALGRVEAKQGRKIDKSGGRASSLPSGEDNLTSPPAPRGEPEAQPPGADTPTT